METLTKAPAVVSAEDEARCEIEAMVGRARHCAGSYRTLFPRTGGRPGQAGGVAGYKSRREALAKLAVEEGGFGNVQDKIASSPTARRGNPGRYGFDQDVRRR